MSYEFIQIPASGTGGGKEELNKLLRGGRIASVRKEFVPNGEHSFWAFCVEVLDAPLPSVPGGKTRTGGKGRIDYKEVLSEADFAVFAKLRELRKTFAEKEAVPAYSVFTNEQLATIVTEKPSSLAELGKINGLGEARIKKYGEAFLAALASSGGEDQ